MKKIKSIIVRYLCITAAIVSILIVILASFLLVRREQQMTVLSTKSMFMQVEHLLEENTKELAEIREDYTRECLYNAETIAYIVESRPSLLENLEELRQIAQITNVDEIHFFNTDGVIFAGTHPEYYNFSVDDGEQIGFFKQMLDDRSLKLVQELTPNTAENKYMQYSAVWSPSGDFFVEIGMDQRHVLEVTEKNELSYIFSLLRVNSNVELYAIDKETGTIMGTTAERYEGRNMADIGIYICDDVINSKSFYEKANGKLSFCLFEDIGDCYIGRIIGVNEMYGSVFASIMLLAAGIILAEIVLVCIVTRFLEKEVITGIKNINVKLLDVSGGNLSERVNVQTCAEFSTLSEHINHMIISLLSSTDKISYVLEKTGVKIGVYEYNEKMRSVRFTGKVASILGLEEAEIQQFSRDCEAFKKFIAKSLVKVSDKENIYRIYSCGKEKYLKYEELSADNSILGIIMDITEEHNSRSQLERERDIDGLTGLLNRCGLDRRLETMFEQPEKLGHGALIMIDADGLKQINDSLGHDAGDAYIKSIGDILNSFGSLNSICSRQGGDEFVLFLYGFESDDEVFGQIRELERVRNERKVEITGGNTVSVKFSFGVSLLDGSGDYGMLLKRADEEMYNSKRERKAKVTGKAAKPRDVLFASFSDSEKEAGCGTASHC